MSVFDEKRSNWLAYAEMIRATAESSTSPVACFGRLYSEDHSSCAACGLRAECAKQIQVNWLKAKARVENHLKEVLADLRPKKVPRKVGRR